MRKFLIAFIACLSLRSQQVRGQALVGDVLRLTPVAPLPFYCNTGDVRFNSSASMLEYCVSSNWNSLQTTGSYITALSGDATAVGPGAVALTLATVNSNVGSFGGASTVPVFTVNGKGLITAANSTAVIAPAGTLSGSTLNASVTTSSLTGLGTITSGQWNASLIPVTFGGTGNNSFFTHGILIGQGTSAVTSFAGLTGSILTGQGVNSDPLFSFTPTLGVNGTGGITGAISLDYGGLNGAAITIQNGGATSAYSFLLPVSLCSNGQAMLSSGNSATPWTCGTPLVNPMTTGGDLIYGGTSGVATRLPNGTANQVLTSNGGTAAETWTTFSTLLRTPSVSTFTTASLVSNGTAGYLFIVTGTTASINPGCVFSNNGHSYTAFSTIAAGVAQLYLASGPNAPAGGSEILTYSSGASAGNPCNGTAGANVTSTGAVAYFNYTVPSSTPRYIKVRMVGAGGGGGGETSGSAVNGTAGGTSYFGPNIAITTGGNGGIGASANSSAAGVAGGTASITTASTVIAITSFSGGSSGGVPNFANSIAGGTNGGNSAFGGAGGGGVEGSSGSAAAPGSGSGGGGGGASSVSASSGGGAGAYEEFLVTNITAGETFPVIIGIPGGSGAGSIGGGLGGTGQVISEEY